ncbi:MULTISPECIES: hypothetical protein [unclassified Cupriavidus]|uniref:hypothetical protein n=1 Tax=unclassified Cupriavidus TaxID=2640874 RepID=UPI001CEDDE32|nr:MULTISPECIES: hypothetical protein [unclassified Cupriavidus]
MNLTSGVLPLLRYKDHPALAGFSLMNRPDSLMLLTATTIVQEALLKTAFAISLLALSTVTYARGGHSAGGYGGYAPSQGYSSGSTASTGDHKVNGYVRNNGAYVQPHMQTNPNTTRNDNYSTRGNVNPYTGVPGTKSRDNQY